MWHTSVRELFKSSTSVMNTTSISVPDSIQFYLCPCSLCLSVKQRAKLRAVLQVVIQSLCVIYCTLKCHVGTP